MTANRTWSLKPGRWNQQQDVDERTNWKGNRSSCHFSAGTRHRKQKESRHKRVLGLMRASVASHCVSSHSLAVCCCKSKQRFCRARGKHFNYSSERLTVTDISGLSEWVNVVQEDIKSSYFCVLCSWVSRDQANDAMLSFNTTSGLRCTLLALYITQRRQSFLF